MGLAAERAVARGQLTSGLHPPMSPHTLAPMRPTAGMELMPGTVTAAVVVMVQAVAATVGAVPVLPVAAVEAAGAVRSALAIATFPDRVAPAQNFSFELNL